MGSARKVGTNESVHTYGGVTREYTALQTWEDAHTVDCVATTTSHVLECYDDAASFDDYVAIAGATTDATYFRIIRPASGQGHDGTPNNGFTINSTTSATVIAISESYAQVQDLIVIATFNSATGYIAVNLAVANTTAVGCLVKATNAGTGVATGFNNTGTVSNILFVDCLAYECKTGGMVINAASGQTNRAYNCTSVNNVGYGFTMGGGTAGGFDVLTNCLSALNTGADFQVTNANATKVVTYCASEDTTADDWGGAGNRISQTFTFVNSGGDDFHLASTDAGARDYGTDLSADATYPFNDDIDKQTRSGSWDIGFDEDYAESIAGILGESGTIARKYMGDRLLTGNF